MPTIIRPGINPPPQHDTYDQFSASFWSWLLQRIAELPPIGPGAIVGKGLPANLWAKEPGVAANYSRFVGHGDPRPIPEPDPDIIRQIIQSMRQRLNDPPEGINNLYRQSSHTLEPNLRLEMQPGGHGAPMMNVDETVFFSNPFS